MFISIKNKHWEKKIKLSVTGAVAPVPTHSLFLLEYVRTPRGDITVWCFIYIL